MKERPILFSAPMVRAILEGRKTQMRLVAIKTSQPRNVYISDFDAAEFKIEIENKHSGQRYWKQCPYGTPGARLWVREAFRTEESYDHIKPSDIPVASKGHTLAVPFWYAADISCADFQHMPLGLRPGKYRPGMFMPRAASRILLEVTGVRVERMNDISKADAIAEGAPPSHPSIDRVSAEYGHADFSRSWYAQLWDQINGAGSWETNPWVWVVQFKRVEA